ncbi:MAG: VanZ family protein [Clostridiaceae bacterium]|nr:VanZ family protein [Clostridiaceae bacterium]
MGKTWRTIGRWVIVIMAAVYIVLLIHFTFFPFPASESRGQQTTEEIMAAVELDPLDSIRRSLGHVNWGLGRGNRVPLRLFIFNHTGNLVLLMPLAMFLCYFLPPKIGKLRIWLICGLVSVGIELAQLALSLHFGLRYRVVDLLDIIENVLGAGLILLIATIIGALGRRFRSAYRRRASRTTLDVKKDI